ncbi:hypothetical protein PIB30_063270 [Stylosanthes scabra]|uniref:Uncharacterized protein n=1 Tax=Stylosanthes scabra TaxID=79078 RepID=A0ABU6TL60_9FABA|nr:hypothetical protein [Stylosanthes scabra]
MADQDLDASNIHISAIQNSQVQIGKSRNSAPITQAKSEFHFIDNISTITTAQVISVQSILNSKTPPDSDSKTEGTTLPVFNLNLETNDEDAEITAEEEYINLGGRETALNKSTEDGAAKTERVEAASLEPAEEVEAIRPPPAPPDLESAVTGACRDVEDSAAKDGTRRTFVDPVARAAMVTDGGLRARLLRRTVLLKLPPLLAVVFPWNRGGDGEEQNRDGLQQREEGLAGDGKTPATITPPCSVHYTAVRSLARQRPSFSSFGNDANNREEGNRLLPMTATAYNPRPQARGGGCGTGPTVVELVVAVDHGWRKLEGVVAVVMEHLFFSAAKVMWET